MMPSSGSHCGLTAIFLFVSAVSGVTIVGMALAILIQHAVGLAARHCRRHRRGRMDAAADHGGLALVCLQHVGRHAQPARRRPGRMCLTPFR